MRPRFESIMCFLASLLVLCLLAEAQNPAPDSIRSLVDVSVGMPGDAVISQLIKNGYTLRDDGRDHPVSPPRTRISFLANSFVRPLGRPAFAKTA